MTSSRHAPRVPSMAIFAMALALPFAAAANHAATSEKDTLVAVYDGRYVAGGRTFDSLDALEAAVRAARPASLLIVACAASAAAAWEAVVPRFEDFPMHLDVVGGGAAACPAIPMPAAASASVKAQPAVEQYWNRRMP